MNKIFLFLIVLVCSQQSAMAACETDRAGVVYCGRGHCAQDKAGNIHCSKYLFGDAVLDDHGNVLCGKGQCVAGTKFKDYHCSTIESGGADRDRFGEVKCYGGCEKASVLMCESQQGR